MHTYIFACLPLFQQFPTFFWLAYHLVVHYKNCITIKHCMYFSCKIQSFKNIKPEIFLNLNNFVIFIIDHRFLAHSLSDVIDLFHVPTSGMCNWGMGTAALFIWLIILSWPYVYYYKESILFWYVTSPLNEPILLCASMVFIDDIGLNN